MKLRHFYEFGPFHLDPAERVLLRNGRTIAVPPKDIETLILLVEKYGHIVEKEELLERVWAGVFVEEGNLARHVSNLRSLLGDGGEGTAFIETIPKRGYRFVAPVRETAEEEAAGVTAEPLGGTLTPENGAERPSRRRSSAGVMAGILFAAVLGMAGHWGWQRVHSSPAPAAKTGRVMIAVLPFQNLTGDASQEYLSDGLTEEMISQMGQLNPQKFGVIARTSSMTYKKTDKTVAQIGKELGVDYILESSMRGATDKMRLTVQLIRVQDQTHLWVHEYNDVATNALAVQTQVTQGVAQELAVMLTPRPGAPRAISPEVYELYLRGQFHLNKRSTDDLSRGIKFFQQAIAKDPNYARAYAGLADCYQLQVYFDQLQPNDGFRKAREAALKAVALDDRLAEAHTSLASIKGDFEWDWAGAETEYKQALGLNPNYATAHHWYADFLAGIGRLEEGTAEIKRAHEIDPLSPVIGVTLGQMYCRAEHCAQGIAEYKKTLVMYPNFLQAHAALAEGYAQMGMYEKSFAEIDELSTPFQNSRVLWGDTLWGYALAGSNRKREAMELAEEVKKKQDWPHLDYTLAVIYAGLGDKDQAFARLEGARRSHDFWMPALRSDGKLGSLRSDPRYKELLQRMNMPLDAH